MKQVCTCQCHTWCGQSTPAIYQDLSGKLTHIEALLASLHDDNNVLFEELAEVKARLVASEKRNFIQDDKVSQVVIDIRMRFLESAKQNFPEVYPIVDKGIIKQGDLASKNGKPVIDAWLYLNDHRTDRKLYIDLYGFSPEQVWKWRNIDAIENVATFLSHVQTRPSIPPQLKKNFVKQFSQLKGLITSRSDLTPEAAEEDQQLQTQVLMLTDLYDNLKADYPN